MKMKRTIACFRVSLVAFLPMMFASLVFAEDTLAVRWNDVLLEAIRNARLGPPMVARAIGVVHTCGFDAWAAYDDVALGTQLGGSVRRPPEERTAENSEKAYSYAQYRCLLDLFGTQSDFLRAQMAGFGFDPDDASTDPATPAGVGNLAAAAVLEFRHHDGSNQLGDLNPGPYSDYTGYLPVNDPDHINDPNRWQPLRFSDGQGGFLVPGFIAPHWQNVQPFALESADQFRPGPPQRWPSLGYLAQALEIIVLDSTLTDRGKMIAEYWADGPRSELPPGHWTLFAEHVSRRDGHTFDQDVQMFFLVGNAVFDAGIACWDTKRFYDSQRPITSMHFLFRGRRIPNTVPFEGLKLVRGENWLPYQPPTFITPPFAEYTSGHSTFSAASAEVLKRFEGNDALGASVTFAPGSGRLEPGFAPENEVTLTWDTFSAAADQAGLSRRLGGIHFLEGDLRGRAMGRKIGCMVWQKAQTYIEGNPPPAESCGDCTRYGCPD
jgi:hypothetical protein